MSKIKHLGELKNIKITAEVKGEILNYNPETAVIIAYDKNDLITLCSINSSVNGTKKIIEQLKNYADTLQNEVDNKIRSNMELIKKSFKYYKNNDIEGFKKACKDGELKDMPEDVAMEMEQKMFKGDLN
jgi:CRISPR/Cas system-associated protein Cas10 (large subunit of type III CRISPR-Cas system)